MEWFQEWFNLDYLDLYPHRDEAQAREEVGFLQMHLGISPDWKIVDVACGSGRHSVALSERGFEVVGVDLSSVLISKAEQTASGRNLDCRFVRGDMRSLPLQSCAFDLSIWLFNSFGYFDDAGNVKSLEEVSRLTKHQGLMAMEYFNRDHVIDKLVEEEELTRDGWSASITRRITSAPERVEKLVELERNGRKRSYIESVRLYSPEELMELAGKADLKPLASFAGFTSVPFHPDAESLLLILQKR
jgi:SAM-dependent methyltransferase